MGLNDDRSGASMGGPIGVFDSGLGGLTVLKALRESLPNQPFVYFGDNANAPYGERSPQEVQALTRAGVEALFAAGCRLVVLACNTASALSLRALQQGWLSEAHPDRRLLGVFVPIVEAVTGRAWSHAGEPAPALEGRRRLLFFATPATVASGAFEREAQARATGLQIVSQACPGLVQALEAHDEAAASALAGAAVARALERAAEAWDAPPDAAVLGCTHYPLAEPAFRAALPPEVEILNQPGVVAASLARYLFRHPEFEASGPEPRLRCQTTGDPEAASRAGRALFGGALAFEAAPAA